MPILAPTVPDRVQAVNRMILRPRRTKNDNSVDTAPKMFQDIVFSIPELVHLITDHLATRDLTALIRVNRTWNSIWTPYLYQSLYFSLYQTNVYLKISKYGEHVKTLCLSFTTWASTQHFLYFTNNLQSLTLRSMDLCTSQLEQITEMVPQIRTLNITLKRSLPQPLDCQMTPVTTLKSLEDFSWNTTANLCIDDILLVLRDCRKLKSLVIIIEELKDARNEQEPEKEEEERTGLIRVDDEGWMNTSLRSLTLSTATWDSEDSNTMHPHFRRLFQHLPSLECLKFRGRSNVIAQAWRDIVEDRAILQGTIPESHATTIGLDHCVGSSIRDDTSATDVMVAVAVARKDQALTQLTRMPRSVHVSPGISHRLVTFDIEGCMLFNSTNASILLENCTILRKLNLLGTMAGTIELFKGSKPWPCANVLENLCMDIQPLEYQPLQYGRPRHPLRLYTFGEMQSIWGRLCSFKSLVGLKLRGEALTLDMSQGLSFAPNLRVVRLEFQSVDNIDTLQEVALKYGQALFPSWIVSSYITYSPWPPAVAVTADLDEMSYMLQWPK